MGKSSSAPKPPDPIKTASAQTATNIGTAIANGQLAQVNQNTPYGSLTYDQTGSYSYEDPLSDRTYDIPKYTASQTFTPGGQRILDNTMGMQENLARLGMDQSGRLGGLLDRPVDLSQISARSDPNNIRSANFQTGYDQPDLYAATAGAGDIQKGYQTDFSADRRRVEDALYDRMAPSLEQDRQQLQQRLADQGIAIGSEAYNRALGGHGRNVNDARLGVIAAGGQEQSRLAGLTAQEAAFGNQAQAQGFGQGLTLAQGTGDQNAQAAQFANQSAVGQQNADAAFYDARANARNSELNEMFNVRSQPLNELSAILSGAQVSNPSFVNTPTPQAATVDYAGLVQKNYESELAAHNAAQAQRQSLFGGLLQAGGSLAGLAIMSDRRLKVDIRRIGQADNGLPIYAYRYSGHPQTQIGFMADEVETVHPDAVITTESGFQAVDYNAAVRPAT